MNEQVVNAINSLILNAISGVEKATNFLVAEIPDVVRQLLIWEMTSNLIVGLIWFSFFLLSVYIFYISIRDRARKASWAVEKEKYYGSLIESQTVLNFVATMASSILGIASLLISLPQFMDALKIWIAPKVWLLEYATHLVQRLK